MKVTAETITDEQIRELRDALFAHPEFATDSEAGWAIKGQLKAALGALEYEERRWIRDERAVRLRARCAEILNARGQASPTGCTSAK